MYNEECPCKKCEERSVGCHASCNGYKEFKAKLEELHKIEAEYRLKNSVYHKLGTPGFGTGTRRARYNKPKDAYVN